MGWNNSAAIKKDTSDPRREVRCKEILDNIHDNDHIVRENNRMICMINRQLKSWRSSETLNRLKKLKHNLIKENEEATVHSDVLRQYSEFASEQSASTKNVLSN